MTKKAQPAVKQWGHNELAADLAKMLRTNTDRMIWENMQLGSSGSVRPDVYALPKSYARFTPLVYEVKISIADFRRDVSSGKWQSYLKYSSGVIFAVPRGLITKADVPATCGLMVRSEQGWTSLKAPTMHVCKTLPHAAWMKLLIDGITRVAPEYRQRQFSEWHAAEVIRKRWGEKLARLFRDVQGAEYQLEAEKKRLEEERAGTSRHVKEIHERRKLEIEQERREIDQMWGELRVTLGLEDGTSQWDIRTAVRNLLEEASAAKEVVRATEALEAANKAVTRALHRASGKRAAKIKTVT